MATADGSIIFSVELDDKKANQELNRLNRKIQSLNEKIYASRQERLPLVAQAEELVVRLDAAKAKLEEMRTASAPKSQIKEQEETVRAMQTQWNNVQRQVERYDTAIQRATAELDRAQTRAGEIEQQLARSGSATNRLAREITGINKRLDKLFGRIVNLAKRVFFFSLITAGLRSVRSWLWNTIKSSDEATAAIAKMKGAFLTLAQPLVSVIIPAFTKLVELLAQIATFAANIIAPLFGTTVEESAQAAKNLYDESNALEETGKEAKKAGKSLASFDEINKLTNNSDSDKKDKDKESDKIAPDFSGMVDKQLGALEAIIGGALLAIGAILTFSGVNIPLGITLMVLGALTLYSVMKENWGEISKILQGELGILIGIISGALLILGAILAFSGVNIPLGLGLMALGAIGLATVYAANWDTMKKVLDGPLGILLAALSGALLVIGAIFVFSGVNLPLGIGLMVAGAIGLATVVAANWDHIVEKLQGPLGIVLAIISGALLVLGAIILFSGANIPLGLGLMIAGAIGLASVVAANWDTVKTLLQGPIGVLVGIVSGALLVIGAVFTFSGANLPLGIALMLVGAAGLATVVAVNWDTVRKALEGPVGAVVALLSGAMLALGGILTFSGHPLLGIGLIAAGAIGLAATIAVNWDSIPELMKGPVGAITALMSTAILAVGAVLAFGAVNIPLGIALMAAGAAGLAMAIAPNWDSIVTALQGPIGVIVGIISGALLVLGVLLLFTPATLPLGLGLIAAGAAGLATAIAPNWEHLKEIGSKLIGSIWEGMKKAWESVKEWVSGAVNWLKGAFTGNTTQKISANSVTTVSRAQSRMASYSLPIPRLATGAVIPPNREFLAVLGDQKSGTNIEAPASEIENAVMRGIQRAGGLSGGSHTAILEIDKRVLGRVMWEENETQSSRMGVRIVQRANT